ncbi:lipoyl synthase [candidate division CSSED10-310 bacterium]|uniref:Lipoyl synthase n=1 Tax=candidate division CSSED10-310 bacterium TaxID=2855610 RepID=A0ABV6YSC4_UNCC1
MTVLKNDRQRIKRLPPWLKVPLPGQHHYRRVRTLLKAEGLNTVCQSARCPNIGECFGSGTATFLILGKICTRKCQFCSVEKGTPQPLDDEEPQRVAHAVSQLQLKYAVITSVTRDDVADGGAAVFAETIRLIKKLNPTTSVEVLIPDFQGSSRSLDIVLAARPDILNHNVETVPRLYPHIRLHASYTRSLQLLLAAHRTAPDIPTKSGLMLGFGERWSEIIAVLSDLRKHQCQMVTIGQYLAPSATHHEVKKYYHPQEFEQLAEIARTMGFSTINSGPLVRSSYRAHKVDKRT